MSSRSGNLKQDAFLKILVQMELALAYGCPESVDRESLVEYIHHNRDLNTRMIGTVGDMALIKRIQCHLSDQGRRLRGSRVRLQRT